MVKYNDLSDIELVALYKGGDKEAFSYIYRKYWSVLVLHAKHMVKDTESARDIVQEVFTSIYRKGDSFELTTSLSAYLYAAVRFGVFGVLKHDKVRFVHIESLTNYFENNFDLADDEFRAKELFGIIEQEIAKMPPKMREIFELSRKQHLSHKQIAKMLDLSEHTVQTQITRALRILKRNKDIRLLMIVGALTISCQ
jgi:RNA polymerase sigma-70 factor (ECF subfamily)